jgi:hypothetical protein
VTEQSLEKLVENIVREMLTRQASTSSDSALSQAEVSEAKTVNEKDQVRRVAIGSDHEAARCTARINCAKWQRSGWKRDLEEEDTGPESISDGY